MSALELKMIYWIVRLSTSKFGVIKLSYRSGTSTEISTKVLDIILRSRCSKSKDNEGKKNAGNAESLHDESA